MAEGDAPPFFRLPSLMTKIDGIRRKKKLNTPKTVCQKLFETHS